MLLLRCLERMLDHRLECELQCIVQQEVVAPTSVDMLNAGKHYDSALGDQACHPVEEKESDMHGTGLGLGRLVRQ